MKNFQSVIALAVILFASLDSTAAWSTTFAPTSVEVLYQATALTYVGGSIKTTAVIGTIGLHFGGGL